MPILFPFAPSRVHAPVQRPGSMRRAVLFLSMLSLLAGCSGSRDTLFSSSAFSVSGAVTGARQPLARANVALYSVAPGMPAVELAATQTDASGAFTFPKTYVCSTPDALLYVKANGGAPAATNIANPDTALMTAIGTCGRVSSSAFATVNELTTVASAWPLAPFVNAAGELAPATQDAAAFRAAIAMTSKLFSAATGTAPGVGLDQGEAAPVEEMNSLANALGACVETSGGLAGDGSVCGHLFALAAGATSVAPSSTLDAAFAFANHPGSNVTALYAMSASNPLYLPALTATPANWKLQTIPAANDNNLAPAADAPAPSLTAGSDASAATGSVISTESTTVTPTRARSADATLTANTITITKGGTYTGNWVSTDPSTAAVLIQTDDPVIIENSTVVGRGHLIQVAGKNAANLTVRNVTGMALDPQVAGKARGAFVIAYIMNSLVVQNCTITGASFGIKTAFSTPPTMQILNNKAINLEDRASDGNGGFQTTRPQMGHFAYLYQTTASSGAEIAWNQAVQTIGQSSTDDLISIYNSAGASGTPINIHDNYVEGGSSPATTAYAASGLASTGVSNSIQNAYVQFVNNQVVHTAGSGLNIGYGHDISAQGNRVVSCGQDSSGNWYSRTGLYATLLYNRVSGSTFYNNTITTTSGGLVVPNSSNAPVASDSYANSTDLATTSNSVSGNQFTDPCIVNGSVNLNAEDAERTFWSNKLSANNQTIGDQHNTVSISPSAVTLQASQTQQFTGSAAGTSYTGVTWSISPAVGSISGSGLYTAPDTIASAQSVTVTATSVSNTLLSASAVVTLKPITVALTPDGTVLQASQTQQYTANVANTSNTAVTWSMSPSVGSLSTSGLYTAPASIASTQNITITATSAADTTKSASVTVTLSPPVAVSVTASATSLSPGQTSQLTATVTNTSNTAVTWSINPAFGTVSSTGLYTAPASLSTPQTVTITATSVADTSKSASTTLTVATSAITISPAATSLYASQTQQFTATVPSGLNPTIAWSISPSTGSISADGIYTAPSSIASQQSVTVTGGYQGSDGYKYSTARVTLVPPVKVNLTNSYFAITVGQTAQFNAQVLNTTNTAVTWSISAPVGSISSSGLYTPPASITSQQTITVTATSVADTTKSVNGTVVLNPPVKVTTVPGTVTLAPSTTQQFTANVAWTNNTAVTWSLSPSLGTISSGGLYTAPGNTTSPTTVTVTATSVADTTKSSSSTITLNPPLVVAVSPTSSTVTVGQTQVFAATVTYNSNTNVTWSISPSVGSIASNGRYTPPSTAVSSPQAVTVTATSAADTTKSASATITVNPPVAVSVSPASSSLYASQSQQLNATVSWNSNTAVNWSISPSVGSISTSGVYTAPSSITSQQTVTVTAASAADNTKYATASIVLLPPVKVNLTNSYFAITVGQTAQFNAVVGNSSNTAVTWTISPSVGTISSSGLYTPPSSITTQQTITVTATSVADSTKSVNGTVVLNPPVKVTVVPGTVTLAPSATQQFTANVAWTSNTSVTWALSPALGTISSSGLYTAPSDTSSPTTVTVTATSVADTTKSSSAVITLNPPLVITVSPGSSLITLGQTQLFTSNVTYNSNTSVTWTISPSLGSIASNGRYSPPSSAVTSPQTVTVTATSAADTTKSASATVTVNPPVAVSLSPSNTSLYASQSQQMNSSVAWNSNDAVTWSISPSVGTISTSGVYTAPSSVGSVQGVTITAISVADPNKYATASITLLPPVKVNLTSHYYTQTVGQTAQLSASVQNTVDGTVSWTLSPAVGSITSDGLYTPPGSIPSQQSITATATSVSDPTKSDSATIVLNPPPSVALVPANVTLTTNHTQQFTANVAWSNNTAVTYTMSPSIGTLTSGGLYTAPASIDTNQTVTITATSVADPSKSATAVISLLTLIGPAPITITEGGTYSGNWVSNDPNVPAVTVATDQPVIIQNSTVQGRGHLILVTGSNGANVTVQNVSGTGLDPQVSGKGRGAFIRASIVNSLTVTNSTMTGTSFGVLVISSPNLTSLSVLRNKAINLEDRASDGNGGFTTSRPMLGHFAQLSNVTAPNGAEIAWNQVNQTIGTTSTEDVFNMYKATGASGYPIFVHDNYMEGFSSAAAANYTGNGMITDGDATTYSAYVLFQANQVVHTAGGGIAIASGHDITARENRVVSCGVDSSGYIYSRTDFNAVYLGDYYGAANFYNNTITGTTGGLLSPNSNGVLVPTNLYAKAADLQNPSNSVSGNNFTDPCLVNGSVNLAAEDAERTYWSNKLSSNNMVLGDQH